jgi:hypothetical protein
MQGLLWATAGLYGLAALTQIGVWASFEDYASRGGDNRVNAWADAEEIALVAWGIAALVWIITFVLLIIWWNQAYKAARRFPGQFVSWSSGWAVGGWFIPVANFIIPRLVMNEIERLSAEPRPHETPGDDRAWRSRPLMGLGMTFWFTMIGGLITTQIASAVYPVGLDDDGLRLSYLLSIAAAASWAVAGITGALFVRRLGARLGPPRSMGY